jgi:hypothetical protein
MSDELKPQSIDSPEFRELLRIYDSVIPYVDDEEEVTQRLIAHIDAWRVPAGYKLTPIESTAEMDLAGRIMLHACGLDQATTRDAELCWSAMIEAAPKPEDA